VVEFNQDLIKAEHSTGEKILRSPINGTVQQLVLRSTASSCWAQQSMAIATNFLIALSQNFVL
jgi:hypothetical protein